MSVDPRQDVLARIRNATGAFGDLPVAQASWRALPRSYSREPQLDRDQMLHLFTERLIDYDADVHRCASAEVSHAVGRALTSVEAKSVVVPAGLESFLRDIHTIAEDTATTGDLDQADAVLTRCTLGIAETGTLVLQSGPGQGRRAATLVPDVHVCIVRVSDIVVSVPEAFARLAQTPTLPTTFVSGPSATADIEMTRIKGVHGPRTLFVVIEEDS